MTRATEKRVIQAAKWERGPISWRHYFRLVAANGEILAEVDELYSGSEWAAYLRGRPQNVSLGCYTTKEAAMYAADAAARKKRRKGK